MIILYSLGVMHDETGPITDLTKGESHTTVFLGHLIVSLCLVKPGRTSESGELEGTGV